MCKWELSHGHLYDQLRLIATNTFQITRVLSALMMGQTVYKVSGAPASA